MEVLAAHGSFGGIQRFYKHDSRVIGLPMRFSVYLPPRALQGHRVPVLYYLAGLTCSEETFPAKSGAQRIAAKLNLALVAPDTSPRGANIPGEADAWDFGVGAGWYLDATAEPWKRHWKMESYLIEELMPLLAGSLPVEAAHAGIFGHSMGGHGALTLALRHPGKFRTVSAFAPVAAPMRCPWGVKAFGGYLGDDRDLWRAHDASELMAAQPAPPYANGILVDQGMDDKFLAGELHPEAFEAACLKAGQPLTLRRHAGYDHSYYFISTFMADHLRHHARQMG